jgi:hypothetical protein
MRPTILLKAVDNFSKVGEMLSMAIKQESEHYRRQYVLGCQYQLSMPILGHGTVAGSNWPGRKP